MLGIIIGVGSVVLMTGIGKSMEGLILGQISTLGPRSMVIFPGAGPDQGAAAVRRGHDSLTFGDLDALQKLSSIKSLAPIILVASTASYGREETSPQIMGTNENFFRNQNITAAQGRLLELRDTETSAAVAVLAPDTAEDLFFHANPLGKRITIGGKNFTVIGITNPVGSQFFQNADERVFIPLTIARAMTGQKYASFVTLQAVDSFDGAFAEIRSLLRQRHQLYNPEGDPEKDDFVVRSSEQAHEILGSVSLGLTLFITIIASISLVVGGIGIMNIMLVTVSERTREIGLRKAVGARKRDILLQFLIEAVLLTSIGGLIGTLLGIGFASLTAVIVQKFIAAYHFALSFQAILLALLMAAGTGLLFGIHPARRAAKLHPIDALRYE